MVKRNIVVAIIIIVLFVLIALVGYGIYYFQHRLTTRREIAIDEEEND